MCSYRNILIFSFIVYFTLTGSNSLVKPGRRVCPISRASLQVLPSQQTYIRPFIVPCDNETECGNSTRLVYKTAVRTVFYRQVVHDSIRKCCPGWTNFEPNDENCMKPICKDECKNGGTCSGPDYCACPSNFTGRLCDLDVDECKAGRHTCQQQCNNTIGGYLCYCFDGFRLTKDGNCEFCPLCLKEFEIVRDKVDELQKRVKSVELSKDDVKITVNNLKNDYKEALEMFGELRSAQAKVTTTTDLPKEDNRINPGNNFDLITSLSDQMGAIEEQIGYLMSQINSGHSSRGGRRRGRG